MFINAQSSQKDAEKEGKGQQRINGKTEKNSNRVDWNPNITIITLTLGEGHRVVVCITFPTSYEFLSIAKSKVKKANSLNTWIKR